MNKVKQHKSFKFKQNGSEGAVQHKGSSVVANKSKKPGLKLSQIKTKPFIAKMKSDNLAYDRLEILGYKPSGSINGPTVIDKRSGDRIFVKSYTVALKNRQKNN